jgi:hypothetical protein
MLTTTTPHLRPSIPSLAVPSAPPLALYSWPTVFWRTNSRRRPTFRHLATRVTSGGRCEPCSGHTIWGRLSEDGDAGLAWDWVEIASGVVAMVDPMRVSTNMQLLDVDGDVLAATQAALHFNQFVRRLPWQDEVRRLLKT